ncbi:MAG: hypothetical protein ABSA92_03505 [Candidatus Bathyarchaeia archaeon]
MTEDDRFDEIRKLLDSTISEFQSLFQSASGFEETRVGNGWTPEKIGVEVYYVQPRPLSDIARIAEARKRSLFGRRMRFLRPRVEEIHSSSPPKFHFTPFWRIKGFHECFYFRGNSYRVPLLDDVIAVEVEGRVRDLVSENAAEPKKIVNLTKRILGQIRHDSSGKSIRLSEVTELAYMFKDSSLFVNSDGKEDLEAEAFFEGNLPLRKIDMADLNRVFPNAEIMKGSLAKEDLVRRLHSLIVKPPTAFSKILSNRFQVTELAEFLMPSYVFEYLWKGLSRKLEIHGYTGAILS